MSLHFFEISSKLFAAAESAGRAGEALRGCLCLCLTFPSRANQLCLCSCWSAQVKQRRVAATLRGVRRFLSVLDGSAPGLRAQGRGGWFGRERLSALRGSCGSVSCMHADTLTPLSLALQDVECFRYRVEDVRRGLTRRVVAASVARDLQQQLLGARRLKEFFERNPRDREVLKRASKQLKVISFVLCSSLHSAWRSASNRVQMTRDRRELRWRQRTRGAFSAGEKRLQGPSRTRARVLARAVAANSSTPLSAKA